MKPVINSIILKPVRIAQALGVGVLLLVLVSIWCQLKAPVRLYWIVRLFNVNFEYNIPTLYAVVLLLFVALLLGIIASLKKKQKCPDVSKWVVLAFGFLYIAVDETVCLHEMLVEPMRGFFPNSKAGLFFYSWVIAGIAVVLILLLFFGRFIIDLPRKTKIPFTCSAFIYIAGSLGAEMIGGWYAEVHGIENLAYILITSVEEGLEMAGVIVFIYALLVYIAESFEEVRFRFEYPKGI